MLLFDKPKFTLDAEWTNDCHGKKDYDGNILSISTRYWPRGGSFWLLNTGTGEFSDTDDPSRQGILPHANSALILRSRHNPYYVELAEKDFVGETEEEVRQQVETWAQEQMDRAIAVLWKEFKGE